LEPGPLQLPDFYQLGALVSGEDVSLRTLLGFLEHLAQGLGLAGKFRFIPGYSPSTEPTIDIQAEHPVHGWLAIGQGGLLRPEVSEALGIELPLLFWNLGLERMAMTAHRLTDMTGLYESDLSKLRLNRGLTARKSDSVSGKDE
jgi:phenylalanyl-tRNA synthetase alpha chain